MLVHSPFPSQGPRDALVSSVSLLRSHIQELLVKKKLHIVISILLCVMVQIILFYKCLSNLSVPRDWNWHFYSLIASDSQTLTLWLIHTLTSSHTLKKMFWKSECMLFVCFPKLVQEVGTIKIHVLYQHSLAGEGKLKCQIHIPCFFSPAWMDSIMVIGLKARHFVSLEAVLQTRIKIILIWANFV